MTELEALFYDCKNDVYFPPEEVKIWKEVRWTRTNTFDQDVEKLIVRG